MTSTGTPPPAGWYQDPAQPATQRWWDGTQWTAHTQSLPAPREMTDSEARNWAMLAHLSALGAAFFALAFLGPLIVFLIKRDEHPFVREQAVEALNFNLSMLLYGTVAGIVTVVLVVFVVGILLIPALILGAVAWLVLCVVAAVKAGRGESFRYPLTIRFVN